MAKVLPYINFADKGKEQLEFYKGIFGGDYTAMHVKDSPSAAQMPAEWGERIFHADFKSGDLRFLGSDIISDQAGLERGNGYSLAVMCDSTAQLKEYYAKLSEGGKDVFPPADSEWGSMFGQCVDKYGVAWMLDSSEATK